MVEGGFRSYHSITESILGFAAFARSQDFNVGIHEVQEALTAGSTGLIQEKEIVAIHAQGNFLRQLRRHPPV